MSEVDALRTASFIGNARQTNVDEESVKGSEGGKSEHIPLNIIILSDVSTPAN